MKYLAILLTLLLVGCEEYINQQHLDVIKEYCDPNGGLHHIVTGDRMGTTYVAKFYCVNGAKFNITWESKAVK